MADIAASQVARPRRGRLLLAGLAGGLALNLAMLLTFRAVGFGWNGGGLLLDPARQSAKLIAVWTALEPLPRVVADPAPVVLGLLAFAVAHAWLYARLAPGWPAGIGARALRFAAVLFVVVYAFWEFFTPVNLFGEPAALVAVELVFWAAIALAEAIAIALVLERWR
jgi:hypothetical protein